ncbi:MAG: type II toxin-antitoxin system Phd/YefM family antitoxin [Clostridia bacterium]
MTNTNVTNARSNLFKLVESCVKYNDVVNINSKDGNVVMISEEEYNGLMETLYLSGIPGMKDSIVDGMKTPDSELEEFSWNE